MEEEKQTWEEMFDDAMWKKLQSIIERREKSFFECTNGGMNHGESQNLRKEAYRECFQGLMDLVTGIFEDTLTDQNTKSKILNFFAE